MSSTNDNMLCWQLNVFSKKIPSVIILTDILVSNILESESVFSFFALKIHSIILFSVVWHFSKQKRKCVHYNIWKIAGIMTKNICNILTIVNKPVVKWTKYDSFQLNYVKDIFQSTNIRFCLIKKIYVNKKLIWHFRTYQYHNKWSQYIMINY
jgi:hypothetical protein